MTKRRAGEPDFTLGFMIQPDSVRDLFLRRSKNVLRRIIETTDESVLAEALTAPTDVGTLSRVLGDLGAIGPAIVEIEPLAPLIARNAGHREKLLERAGGALSATEVGELLGLTRQTVDKRRRKGSLLALRQGRDWRYPRCQFKDADTVPGLAEVVRDMAEVGPWVILDFLLAPDTVLGGLAPLQALARGDIEKVLRLVRAEAADSDEAGHAF